MPKEQHQITMTKSLHRHTTQTTTLAIARIARNTTTTPLKQRQNIVHDATNVEQHVPLGFYTNLPLPNAIPERANPLAAVEGVPSRLLQALPQRALLDTSARPVPKFKLGRVHTLRASCQVSENPEPLKKPEPDA